MKEELYIKLFVYLHFILIVHMITQVIVILLSVL